MNISMSDQKWFAPSGEVFVKNVAAGVCSSVTLNPAFSQLVFSIAWVAWRTAFTVVL